MFHVTLLLSSVSCVIANFNCLCSYNGEAPVMNGVSWYRDISETIFLLISLKKIQNITWRSDINNETSGSLQLAKFTSSETLLYKLPCHDLNPIKDSIDIHH